MVREAQRAKLVHFARNEFSPSLLIEPPHERILLVRFPAGDGGEGGIEYYG